MNDKNLNRALPRALIELIDTFATLPGVGQKTAERYALAVLKRPRDDALRLSHALAKLHDSIKRDPITFALLDADADNSPLYDDPARNKKQIAIVEDPFDVLALESTNIFHGTYHVLGGAISPIDGIGPDALHIPELISRIRSDQVEEVILATSASVEGESTALYIQKALADANLSDVKITRLARGLPVGTDLEYADQVTLSHALNGRREI